MIVLVTGGAGFIGSHLVGRLLEEGHEVVVVDDLSTGRAENLPQSVRLACVDVTVEGDLRDVFAAEAPDAVFHYAARANVARSIEDPVDDAMVNVVGGLNVMRASIDSGVSRFIFASTGGAMYGDPARLPVSEEWPANPLSSYGVSKLALERYLDVYRDQLSSISLRYANVYGPRQDPSGETGVIAIFVRRLLSTNSVVVYGDGRATRDYIYVTDAVDAACKALHSSRQGAYNIGTGEEVSVNDVIESLAMLLGKDIVRSNQPARVGEVKRMALNASRAAQDLNWEPQVLWLDGLRLVIQFEGQGGVM